MQKLPALNALMLLLLLPSLISAAAVMEDDNDNCCRDPDSDLCVAVGEKAMINDEFGYKMQCKCELIDGMFTFNGCRSTTCEDAVSGERKNAGETVRYRDAESDSILTCKCAGMNGMVNCRTAEQIANEGKCRDQITGELVARGQKVSMIGEGQNYTCVCNGTNQYAACRSNMCADVSGELRKPGEQVSVQQGSEVLVCTCAGMSGYQNCKPRDKCIDMNGKFVNKGARFDAKIQGKIHSCMCHGNNEGKGCKAK